MNKSLIVLSLALLVLFAQASKVNTEKSKSLRSKTALEVESTVETEGSSIGYTASVFFSCTTSYFVANDWSYNPSSAQIFCSGTGRYYLGGYGNGGSVTSPAMPIVTHKGVIVSFNLAWIDSWDGEAFKVLADGNVVYQQTHWFAVSSMANTCQAFWNDAYEPVTFGFNHTAPTLVLTITSTLDQPNWDEAWGVCDFSVTASKTPVYSDGSNLVSSGINLTPTTYFACDSPKNVGGGWSYNPAYATIACSGRTYVGLMGQGGYLTSPAFDVVTHKGMVVSFQIAWIDSWDGETFRVSADGAIVYSRAYNSFVTSKANTCQAFWFDSYDAIKFGFNHTSPTIVLSFTSSLDQPNWDEGWGICDLTINAAKTPVYSDGTPVVPFTLGYDPQTFFTCASPASNGGWQYNPSFATIGCNGRTYVGPFGQGHYMNSPTFDVVEHKGIILSFQLAWIDSWDSEFFRVLADGSIVVQKTWNIFVNPKANYCGAFWNDGFDYVQVGFNHTSPSLFLSFTSTLDQPNWDEGWGVCDVTVQASTWPVLADGTPVRPITLAPQSWFPCSLQKSESLWSYSPSYTTINCNGKYYIGPMGSGAKITSPKFSVATHQGIVATFNLAWIDSWDGEAFKVTADGVTVFSVTHNFQTQSKTNTCQNGWTDAYDSFTFGFNHTADTLTFAFQSGLDQPASDEAWGICDLNIYGTPGQVYADGTPVQYISSGTAVWFSCLKAKKETTWKYVPAYTSITCNGKDYIGPFGSGGKLTSPLYSVGTHKGIVVSFNVAWIDSWDGEALKVSADGVNVYSNTHNFQTDSKSNTCQNSWNDAYETVKFGFNHTADTMKLEFTSGLDQASTDEAWGICDVTLYATSGQVYKDGSPVLSVSAASPTIWFPCDNNAKEVGWKYTPAYNAIYCNGKVYTGPFGQGGQMVSPSFNVGTHNGIIVSFQLAWVDSWDGEALKITADGTTVYSATHQYLTQSKSNTCQGGWNDAYEAVKFGFNHTDPQVKLTFTSSLDQASGDEGWAFCDLTVVSTTKTVNKDGTMTK